MIRNKMLVMLFASNIIALHAASSSTQGIPEYPVLCVPGQNELGSENWYVMSQLGRTDEASLHRVETPDTLIDFGQRFCQRHLTHAYKTPSFTAQLSDTDGYIMHATSQGTQTSINWLANNPDKQPQLKALVLEAVMASANNAIAYNGVDHFLSPHVARTIIPTFWTYNPWGMQAIKSVDKLQDKDTPIIIVHATGDMCLPYAGATAIYYQLKERGHNNVYFITKNNSIDHVNILDDRPSLVQAILAHHNIIPHKNIPLINLDDFKPKHWQFHETYSYLRFVEWVHSAIFWSACLYGGYKLYKSYNPQFKQFFADRGITSLSSLLAASTSRIRGFRAA
jgi:hypothetical protein